MSSQVFFMDNDTLHAVECVRRRRNMSASAVVKVAVARLLMDVQKEDSARAFKAAGRVS